MIDFRQVSKQYGSSSGSGRSKNSGASAALSDVSLSIEAGELVYLAGPSGAGKSTLLKMIAAMERPSSGTVSVNGQDIGRLGTSGIPYLRRKLGLMFQPANLLNDRSVLANVMLPLLVTGASRPDADKRARAALSRVGLEDKAASEPLALSGGEQQRVAIARAIVNRPQIILADEPTANLDRGTADKVMDALRAFHEAGVTCLIATHDESILQGARRVIRLEKGRVVPGQAASPAPGAMP
jgi:cell division transport system ATP-binding protein